MKYNNVIYILYNGGIESELEGIEIIVTFILESKLSSYKTSTKITNINSQFIIILYLLKLYLEKIKSFLRNTIYFFFFFY